MRRFGLLLAALLCLACGAAWADDFTLPGLEADSDAYANSLTVAVPGRRHATGAPPGGAGSRRRDPQAGLGRRRRGAGRRASRWAMRRRHNGWRSPRRRCAARRPRPTAPCRPPGRTSPRSDTGAAEVPAAAADGRRVAGAEPAGAGDPGAGGRGRTRARRTRRSCQTLDDARRAAGILVRRVATEPEAEPPRACIDFTVAPARRDDFHAEDWVRLDPPVPGRGGNARGRSDLRLRPALRCHHAHRAARRHARRGRPQPGEGHQPQCRHGQPASAHRLRHAHVRAAARPDAGDRHEHGQPLRGEADPGAPDRAQHRRLRARAPARPAGRDPGTPTRIGEQTGRIVWQGSAAIPNWEPNRSAHTALPLPDALAAAGPGLYALTAHGRRRHAERADRACR